MTQLNKLFQEVVNQPYDDRYDSGGRFFFDLNHLETAAGEHHVADNRSAEVDAIQQPGGFNTVPRLDHPELEQILW